VRHRVVIETLCSQLRLYNSINNLYLFFKEDYYVKEIDLFSFFCFCVESGSTERSGGRPCRLVEA
jgi:hypothetical protein